MGGTVGVGGAGGAASVLGYTWLAVSVSSSLRSDGGNDVGSWPRSRGRHAVPLGVGFRVGGNSCSKELWGWAKGDSGVSRSGGMSRELWMQMSMLPERLIHKVVINLVVGCALSMRLTPFRCR